MDAACDALVANPPAQESDILQAQAENEAARLELLEATPSSRACRSPCPGSWTRFVRIVARPRSARVRDDDAEEAEAEAKAPR